MANDGVFERASSDTHAGPVDPANDSRRRDTRQRTKRRAGHLASGRLRPEPQAVADIAGDAFCHAELRVCGIDRSGVWARTITVGDVHRRWLTARIFPSVSLNQAVLAPPPVAMLFFIVIPGISYSSNFTPRAFNAVTSASTSLTCQYAWLALEVPAFFVGYMKTSAPPHS